MDWSNFLLLTFLSNYALTALSSLLYFCGIAFRWTTAEKWNLPLGTFLVNMTKSAPENGQRHSNNSLALADELFECFWLFCGDDFAYLLKKLLMEKFSFGAVSMKCFLLFYVSMLFNASMEVFNVLAYIWFATIKYLASQRLYTNCLKSWQLTLNFES